MVDITSLKARLAKLRLGSEFDDKHPDLADPVTKERKEKKKTLSGWSYGRDAKVRKAQDPYNEYTKNPNKRKKNNKLTRSDQKRGSLDAGDGDYTKNTGGKRKKKNKLTRSDQKRGKIDMKKLRAHQKKNKIQGPNYEKGYKILNEYNRIPEEDRHTVDKKLKRIGL